MKAKTIITQTLINRIHSLYKEEVPLREIARRVGVAPSTVFRVLHGQQVSGRFHRCPTCGKLLRTKKCLFCKMIERFSLRETDGGELFVGLQLKPEHYKRYLKVRENHIRELEKKLLPVE